MHAADVIGLTLPITGRYSAIAKRVEFGALLAIEELRARGQKYSLKLVNDGCKVKNTASIANKLLDADAKFVIGALCFKQATALVKALNTNDGNTPVIPVLAYNTRNRLLARLRTIERLPLYSLSNSHDAEARAVVKYVLPRFSGKPFAILDDGSVYGRSLSDEIRLLGEEAGFKPVLTTNFRPLQTSYISLLRGLDKSGVEAVFIAASARDIITISRGMTKLKYKWMMGTGEQAILLPLTSGFKDVASGLFMVQEGEADQRLVKQISKKLKGSKRVEPALLAGYAMVQIAAETIQRKNAPLIKATFNTVLGRLKFTPKGRAVPFPFKLYSWNGSTFNLMGSK